jgi:hypothetical protein
MGFPEGHSLRGNGRRNERGRTKFLASRVANTVALGFRVRDSIFATRKGAIAKSDTLA